ncbi:MAG: helix-hairpin-helix domain-containing protein [Candidatus Hermodarchaeota archaeon]
MGSNLQAIDKIGKTIADRLISAGIDTVEKLANIEINKLLKIKGIGKSTAHKYKEYAKKLLKELNKNKVTDIEYVSSKHNKETISGQNAQLNVIEKKSEDHQTKSINLEKIAFKANSRHKEKENMSSKQRTSVSKTKSAKTDIKKDYAKKKEVKIGYANKFFKEDDIQRIRFLHFRISNIEDLINKESYKEIPPNVRDLFYEYLGLLNKNYKTRNHNLILRDLDLTQKYFDPLENKDINIYDIMFECARALWVMAKTFNLLSESYENKEEWEYAIAAMFQCSKAYKTASYFSAAAIHQELIGTSLNANNLELKAEESRILAQSLASICEENKKNYFLASNLYSGLSSLSKRLYYLEYFDEKKKLQLKAQYHYDLGRACNLYALGISESLGIKPKKGEKDKETKRFLQKAIYYYSEAEKIWEFLLNNFKDITKEEKDDLKRNLSIVNENIMEIDEEVMAYDYLKDIPDPKPILGVPENITIVLPKSINYLTNFPYKETDIALLRKFKNIKFEDKYPMNKKREILNKKAAAGRVIKELKVLFENDEIEIDKYTELLEKYTSKYKMLDSILYKIDNIPEDKNSKE